MALATVFWNTFSYFTFHNFHLRPLYKIVFLGLFGGGRECIIVKKKWFQNSTHLLFWRYMYFCNVLKNQYKKANTSINVAIALWLKQIFILIISSSPFSYRPWLRLWPNTALHWCWWWRAPRIWDKDLYSARNWVLHLYLSLQCYKARTAAGFQQDTWCRLHDNYFIRIFIENQISEIHFYYLFVCCVRFALQLQGGEQTHIMKMKYTDKQVSFLHTHNAP